MSARLVDSDVVRFVSRRRRTQEEWLTEIIAALSNRGKVISLTAIQVSCSEARNLCRSHMALGAPWLLTARM